MVILWFCVSVSSRSVMLAGGQLRSAGDAADRVDNWRVKLGMRKEESRKLLKPCRS
jgi:hypothetical protein